MNNLETLSQQHAAHDSEEIEAIKAFAMDVMQVKKGRRDEVTKVLNVALYLVSRKLTPDMINVRHDKPKPKEPINTVEGSPWLSEEDHNEHMMKHRG